MPENTNNKGMRDKGNPHAVPNYEDPYIVKVLAETQTEQSLDALQKKLDTNVSVEADPKGLRRRAQLFNMKKAGF